MSGQSSLTADVLRSFARSLGEAEPNEGALARAAAESVCRLLMARQCSVWLLGPKGKDLVLRAAIGFDQLDPASIGRLTYPLERPAGEPLGITPWVYVTQQPVVADTYRELTRYEAYRGEFEPQLHGAGRDTAAVAHPRQQFCGVPISLGSRRFGVLKVENKTVLDEEGLRRFSPADLSAVETLVMMLAVALRHAQVTRDAEERLGRFHDSTAHSIRGELMELARAEALLAACAGDAGLADQRLADALRMLRIGAGGLSFWLDNLEHLLSARLPPGELPTLDLEALVRNEVLRLRQIAGHQLEAHLDDAPSPEGPLLVRGDNLFLTAAVREVLRHAYREVVRRQEREALQQGDTTVGDVAVRCRLHEKANRLPAPHVCLSVADNGEASCHEGARDRLLRAWSLAAQAEGAPDSRHAGLTFLSWVAREHGGYVDCRVEEGRAVLELHLPLAPVGEHTKEGTDG